MKYCKDKIQINLTKQARHDKLVSVVISYHFHIFNLKGPNSNVCLRDETRFPAHKSRKIFSVRSLFTVFRLIDNSDYRLLQFSVPKLNVNKNNSLFDSCDVQMLFF
jgi:hypothetical protein